MVPPGATMSSQVMNDAGTPTASLAVSTPRPPVIFITVSEGLPSEAWMVVVAPSRFDICRRLSSRSMASGGSFDFGNGTLPEHLTTRALIDESLHQPRFRFSFGFKFSF